MSAVRAALGHAADDPDTVDAIEVWATEHQADTGADASYFDRTWRSLDKGVYASRDALDRLFRQHGIFEGARADFPDDADALNAEIIKRQGVGVAEKAALLAEVAGGYVFSGVNLRTDDSTARVRPRHSVKDEWPALAWWMGETLDDGVALLGRLQKIEGWGPNKVGLYRFLRGLKKARPDTLYTKETRHPLYDIGEMVEDQDGQGNKIYAINMRPLPEAQKFAKRPPRNTGRADRDVKTILNFMGQVFGPQYVGYELDTLAYMAQTGRRPGHMLFLVGDQGTGKSLYAKFLISLFDGDSPDSEIAGDKIANENSRRFAYANFGSCRITNINEMPVGKNRDMTIAELKGFVDGSKKGDRVAIEKKGKDIQSVLNFTRIVITTNHRDALAIERGDRRTFYVVNGIDETNNPGPDYFAPLWAIVDDPERQAAFWRYLLARDVIGYRFADPPPVSLGKIEAQMLGTENPCERHMEAALMALRRAGRALIDSRGLAELMTAMADNEWKNTRGAVDNRREYHFQRPDGQEQAALRRLAIHHADKLRDLKSNGKWLPMVYVLRSAGGRPGAMLAELAQAKPREVGEALDRDRQRYPLNENHPSDRFAGPIRPHDTIHGHS